MPVPFLACMALVASVYDLPPRVLPAIHHVEGGQPGSVSSNANGSQDLGVMQVNTVWLSFLAKRSGLPPDEVRARLINDHCFNIAAAGAIMRFNLDEVRGDLLQAVGNYHSHTSALHNRYQRRVLAAARLLFE